MWCFLHSSACASITHVMSLFLASSSFFIDTQKIGALALSQQTRLKETDRGYFIMPLVSYDDKGSLATLSHESYISAS